MGNPKIDVGTTVHFLAATGGIRSGNFRGYTPDGQHAVVVVAGRQWAIDVFDLVLAGAVYTCPRCGSQYRAGYGGCGCFNQKGE